MDKKPDNLKIHLWPNSVLETKAQEINDFTQEGWWPSVLAAMSGLMAKAEGIGLAGPQVGISKRFFIMLSGQGGDPEGHDDDPFDQFDPSQVRPIFVGNPKVVQLSNQRIIFEEGCLSLPNKTVPVERHKSLKAEYFDENGRKQQRSFFGLEAICFQHESDHLDGITILDKLAKIAQGDELEEAKTKMIDQKNRLIRKSGHLYT